MALASSAWRESRGRSLRSQFSISLTSSAMRIVPIARRCSADNPLISRKIALIRRTASSALRRTDLSVAPGDALACGGGSNVD